MNRLLIIVVLLGFCNNSCVLVNKVILVVLGFEEVEWVGIGQLL